MTSSPKRYFSSSDQASCTWRRTASLLVRPIMALGLGLVSQAAPATAMSVDKVLAATPLVLKDGRIAEVSVHTIPFPDDAVAPASKIKNELDDFTRNIATDCFLTAQVIGHVDQGEIGGRETADIHRLARARADTIQTSLIDNGLPTASIASVWDWRFMVQEARVTLWVFRLTAGEDCEGTPLGSEGEDQIAAVAAPESPPVETASPAVAADQRTPSPGSIKEEIIPAAKPKRKEITAPLPAVPSLPKDVKTDGLASAETATATGETKIAALSPNPEVDKTGAIGLVDGDTLEIVFATNSSYFPEGAGDQLRAFMSTLDKNTSYVLRIQTSVDGAASVSGAASSDDAQRYNAWLAERRFKRVEAWLLKNADGRKLTLEPSLIENDGSRRVRIEPNPLG